VKDRRPDPGNSKKRTQRATGGPSPRAADSRRGSDNPRSPSDNPQSRSEGARRSDRRSERPEAEPGFGPFRGAGRARRKREDEAQTVRSMAEEAVARASGEKRPALRVVRSADNGDGGFRSGRSGTAGGERGGKGRGQEPKGRGGRRAATVGVRAAQRPKPVRDGARLQEALVRGARALERGYEREALRILRPWRDAHPDSPELRGLLGLTYYRVGRWALAQKELEAFVGLTDSTEQHPVLMDVNRALGRFKRVEQLWEELRAASPGAEIVTEGRIVYAGALGDQGRLDAAIGVLERAPANPKRILPHHLRLWYALADLHERAGDIPAARALFRKISAQDPSFVDVAERLAALS
jgi:thioredoxin-like negative regulator of GroEL